MPGAAAGLGFGISDVAIKGLSGDLESGIGGLLRPWNALVGTAAVASAPSLQVGDGVAVIAVTSAANMSMIVAAWWGGARITAFLLVLVAAALMPAPVRAGEELNEPGAERVAPSPSSA